MTNDAGAKSPFSLSGRVALVTGSSVGLGKALALALGEARAKVAINYANNAQRAEKTFKEFKARGFEGTLVRADVTDEREVDKMVAQIGKTLGAIDILVLNATCDQ